MGTKFPCGKLGVVHREGERADGVEDPVELQFFEEVFHHEIEDRFFDFVNGKAGFAADVVEFHLLDGWIAFHFPVRLSYLDRKVSEEEGADQVIARGAFLLFVFL